MEASAIPASRFGRLTSTPALLRLRSDEQLVAMLRAGSPDAFRAIHDRYGQRLFAYVRQMLGPGSRQDAEDVLQDVFARTYATLRSDDREVNLRPWLYRVAHNRCIDHLRRPVPLISELTETSGKPLHDPFDVVQRREDLQRLVADISRLPDQQKSALLLREINGLSYRELAEALDVSVAAVKSLLVRARVELVESAEARDTGCEWVREELALAADQRTRQSPRARRHLRDCAACRDYRTGLLGVRRSFAALSPVAVVGPLALAGKLIGLGSSGGGGASAGAGGLASGIGGGMTVGTAGKVAAVVSTAALAGGAVEIDRRSQERAKAAPAAASPAPGTERSRAAPAPLTSGAADRKAGERGTNSPAAVTRGAGRTRERPARERSRTERNGSERREAPGTPVSGGQRPAGAPVLPGPSGGGTAPPGSQAPAGVVPPVDAPVLPTVPEAVVDPAPVVAPLAPEASTPVPTPEAPVLDPSVPALETPIVPPVTDKVKIKPDKPAGPKPGRGRPVVPELPAL